MPLHKSRDNLYVLLVNSPGEKGVGLQPLCARVEEWVPGDVILTGRGQLSQYNKLTEKYSTEKKRIYQTLHRYLQPNIAKPPEISIKLVVILHLSSIINIKCSIYEITTLAGLLKSLVVNVLQKYAFKKSSAIAI